MMDPDVRTIEERLLETARSLPYPDTPRIAAVVRQRLDERFKPHPRRSRRFAWALAAALVLAAGLLLTPSVRAAVLDFFSIGVIRIFRNASTPTPAMTVPAAATQGVNPLAPSAPTPTAEFLTSVLSLSGRTTLEAAQRQVDFPVRLPADLGEPDYVFLQNLGSPMLVLVWTNADQPELVELSLHLFGSGGFAGTKVEPVVLEETEVNGHPAVWTEGPYLLRLQNEDLDLSRLVDGNVLIWVEDGITYRLETRLDMEEAREIAESLR